MSEEITADAVPIKDKPRTTAESKEEKTHKMNMNTPERMAESSDSCDSNEADARVSQYQDSGSGTKTQNIQHQVVIQNPTGVVHLGPVYNLNLPTATHSDTQHNQLPDSQGSQVDDNLSDCGPGRDRPPKEEMRPLWYSKRVIEQEELATLAHNIGANWKAVGNGLKFNWAQLDQFEADTKTMYDAVQRMLFRWIQWKDQKATVGKLTKVLFNHGEYDAIRCLKP